MAQWRGPASNDTCTERNEFNRQYENSRSVVHTRFQQGRVQQLSVSVLLNNQMAPKGGWSRPSWIRSSRWCSGGGL